LFGRLSRFPFVFKKTRLSHRTGCSVNESSMNEESISELAAGDAALLDLGAILGQNFAFSLIARPLLGGVGRGPPPSARGEAI
jgi:hypothetical protein